MLFLNRWAFMKGRFKVSFYLLCVLCIIIPFYVDPRMASKFILSKWCLFQCGVLLLALSAVYVRKKSLDVWASGLAFLLLWCAFSLFKAVDLKIAFFYWINIFLGIVLVYLLAIHVSLRQAKILMMIF